MPDTDTNSTIYTVTDTDTISYSIYTYTDRDPVADSVVSDADSNPATHSNTDTYTSSASS